MNEQRGDRKENREPEPPAADTRASESGKEEHIYQQALELQSHQDSYEDQMQAIDLFQSIYFYKDADKAFSEMHRVLKDGGRFICGFYSKQYYERSEKYQFEGETYYSTRELKELVQAHGFENVKIKVVDEKKFMYCLVGKKRGNEIDNDSSDE